MSRENLNLGLYADKAFAAIKADDGRMLEIDDIAADVPGFESLSNAQKKKVMRCVEILYPVEVSYVEPDLSTPYYALAK